MFININFREKNQSRCSPAGAHKQPIKLIKAHELLMCLLFVNYEHMYIYKKKKRGQMLH
jgi:hypothetical protein